MIALTFLRRALDLSGHGKAKSQDFLDVICLVYSNREAVPESLRVPWQQGPLVAKRLRELWERKWRRLASLDQLVNEAIFFSLYNKKLNNI